jgi:predicted branched-subunit amino acid permease
VADALTSELAPAERRAIVRDSLGVGIATGLYGVSFGAVSVAAGLSVLKTFALSLVMFTGASQFAFVGVAASGGAPLSGALTALMLGTRNTLYGLKLAPLLTFHGWRRGATAQLVIDESKTYGLDAAVGGAFLALLWPRLADPRNRLIAVCAVAVALGVVPITTAGVPVLVAGEVALLAGVLTRTAPDETELPRR